MRNVWKGLVIGAFTGASAGLMLDLGERGVSDIAAFGGKIGEQAPRVADHVRGAVSDAVTAATEFARATDLPSASTVTSNATDAIHRAVENVDRHVDRSAVR